MAEERSFLNEGYVYVSNTRIILNGTTYATANVTSVRKHIVPANRGCALVLALFSGLGALSVLPMALTGNGDGFWAPLIFCAILLVVGILWFRAMTPTYHLMLATAGGERSGLWSKDEGHVDRVAAAVTDAIVHRG
jgi:hypothetical protein